MVSNRLGFVTLGLVCVAAAGGGGYLATRQNLTERAAPAAIDSQPVQQAEAVVGSAAGKQEPETAGASSAPPAPATPAARPRAAVPAPSAKTDRRTTPAVRDTGLPALTESSPPAQPDQAAQAAAPEEPLAPDGRQEDAQPELARVPEPEPIPERTFDELVVAADSVIGLQMESTLTSERARVEDRVEARVIRDVRVNGQVAIPAGSRAIGSVTAVDRGGKFKERARIGIRFTHAHAGRRHDAADHDRDDLSRRRIPEQRRARRRSAAARSVGAILGAILGGAKGAAIGGSGRRRRRSRRQSRPATATPATFPSGTQLTARFLSPVTVTVEK